MNSSPRGDIKVHFSALDGNSEYGGETNRASLTGSVQAIAAVLPELDRHGHAYYCTASASYDGQAPPPASAGV
jgi:hypothetical protein